MEMEYSVNASLANKRNTFKIYYLLYYICGHIFYFTCTRYKLHFTILIFKIINMAPVQRLYLRLLTSVASPPASPPAAEHSSRALVCTAVVAPFFLASLHTCVHEDGLQAP